MQLTRHGSKEIALGTTLCGMLIGLILPKSWKTALLVLPFWIWLIAFFRDPDVEAPAGDELLSPSDGKVTDITRLERTPFFDEPCLRIGVFLSVFDVHVNRSPMHCVVLESRHKQGDYRNALKHQEVSDYNEAQEILLGDLMSREPKAHLRLIAGAIARRIIFPHTAGDAFGRGERIGMIKFGSRTELIVPLRFNPEALVSIGDRVVGGRSQLFVVRS